MICLKCGHTKTSVTNSRYFETKHQTWRRRKCTACSFIFTTYESISLEQLLVEGKPFERTRLLLSIGRCFEHSTTEKVVATEGLTRTIIEKIISANAKDSRHDITKKSITEITYQTLKNYDHLASIQYAARHTQFLKHYLR